MARSSCFNEISGLSGVSSYAAHISGRLNPNAQLHELGNCNLRTGTMADTGRYTGLISETGLVRFAMLSHPERKRASVYNLGRYI